VKNFKKASFVAMIMLLSAQMNANKPQSTEPEKSNSWFTARNAKIAAGTAVAVGAGAAAYIYRDDIKAYWNSLTSKQQAAEIAKIEIMADNPELIAELETLKTPEVQAEIEILKDELRAEVQDEIIEDNNDIDKNETIVEAKMNKSEEAVATSQEAILQDQKDIDAQQTLVTQLAPVAPARTWGQYWSTLRTNGSKEIQGYGNGIKYYGNAVGNSIGSALTQPLTDADRGSDFSADNASDNEQRSNNPTYYSRAKDAVSSYMKPSEPNYNADLDSSNVDVKNTLQDNLNDYDYYNSPRSSKALKDQADRQSSDLANNDYLNRVL